MTGGNNAAFKLLLVEDNPGDADLARERLADMPGYDFEITQAGRLEEAEATLRREPMDAVILDLNLPDSHGIETLRRLRRIRNEMAIIVLSGVSTDELRHEALAEGAQEFLSKSEPASRLVARSFIYAMERHRILNQQKQTEQLVATNPDAVMVVDDAGLVRFANKAALELFGRNTQDFIGAAFGFPIKENEVSQIEFQKDGKTRIAQVRAARLDWEGRPAFLAAVRDITEQKTLAEQLLQSQKMEALGLLAGGVAHDFNNLLTVIVNCANFLADEIEKGDPRLHDVSQILGAASRAEALVSQLLSLTRKKPAQPDLTDLGETVRAMQPLLRRTLRADIQLDVQVNGDLWAVFIDRGRFDQVLMNLAVNAKDAMPNGGKLTITAENAVLPGAPGTNAKGEHVVLKISDTGCGIGPETIGKIFDPFFTTKAPGKGTGLGLATCYAIVQQAGGEISVESKIGSGTSFIIRLPRSSNGGAADKGEEKSVSPAKLSGHERLLVAEDDNDVRTMLTGLLSRQGYSVLAAVDGQQALEFAKEQGDQIAMVLSDVVMPRMNGHELARNLRAMKPDMKILMMTGYDDAAGTGPVENAPDTIFKPFRANDLLGKIRQLLDTAVQA